MKNPLNLIPVLALAAAALTVLPACKAVPKDAPVSEPAPAVAEAPAESCDPVIYPAGVVAASGHIEEAEAFVSFLGTDEAMKVFEKYGFSRASE